MPEPDTASPPSPAAARPPRPSATVVVVRDAGRGIEVLLSRRAERGDHNSGAWVFPGGLVDAGDRQAHAFCAGLDDGQASERLGIAAGGLDYYIAAVRECFEESGLLFGSTDGALIEVDDVATERLAPWRGWLHRGERTLSEFCTDLRSAACRRPADLPESLDHADRPRQALRHALLPRDRAAGPDRRARRPRAGRAALAEAGRCAARARRAEAADTDPEDARAADALREHRRAARMGQCRPQGRADGAAHRQRQPGHPHRDAGRAGLGRARPHRPARATVSIRTTSSPMSRCGSRRA